jgi:hypothetical protein
LSTDSGESSEDEEEDADEDGEDLEGETLNATVAKVLTKLEVLNTEESWWL